MILLLGWLPVETLAWMDVFVIGRIPFSVIATNTIDQVVDQAINALGEMREGFM